MICTRFKNEPICDYSLDANVKAAERAIAALEAGLGGYHPAVIGGRSVETEKSIVSLCPALPDRVVGRAASCTRAHVDEAIAEAQKAFASWARTDPEIRAETLMKLAALIRRDRFDFLALLSYEIGKDWYEADAEIAEAIDFCEYYARLALKHFQYQPLTRIPTEDNCFYYIPLGVGAVIAPWNFPLAILAGMTMAAVVSGNAVLLKPSSDTPVIAARFVALAREAGVPDGVINLLPGPGGEVGDYLVTHPQVRFVAFTGSADVGLRINEIASKPDPRAPLDDALHPRDGRQGRHRRGRDRRPGRGGERRGALGLRLPGTEVLGLLAPDRRLVGQGPPARADRREDEAAARRPAVERPLRLHRPGGEREGARRHPRGHRARQGGGPAGAGRARARPPGLLHRARPSSTGDVALVPRPGGDLRAGAGRHRGRRLRPGAGRSPTTRATGSPARSTRPASSGSTARSTSTTAATST